MELLLDRVLCVAGAVLFSQLPEFMQQYLQRLEGHLDEARLQLGKFRQAAEQSGMTLDQLVASTGGRGDAPAARLGSVVADTAARVERLAAADQALRGASPLGRPFAFIAHLDLPIARATWSIYRPAVPTTLEGLAYAALGMLVLLAAYHLGVRAPIARRLRARGPAGGPPA